jgi:hypothetical protein
MSRSLQFGTVLGVALALFAGRARAQIAPIPEMPITMSGQVNFGYQGGADTERWNSQTFGVNANVDGYYHNPNFLRFTISPNYQYDANHSFAATNNNSTNVSANVEFLGGSFTPITFQYTLIRSSFANLAGPLTPFTVSANSLSSNYSIGWSLRLKKLPNISAGYTFGNSSSDVTGSTLPELSGHNSGYYAQTNYALLKFRMFARYSKQNTEQQNGNLLQLGPNPLASGKADRETKEVGVSRSLPWKTQADFRYSWNKGTFDLYGLPQNQDFNTANVNVSSAPTRKLSLSFSGNYTTNAVAQRTWETTPNSNSASGATSDTGILFTGATGSSKVLTGNARYDLGRGLSLQADQSRVSTELSDGTGLNFTQTTGGVIYNRPFMHGHLGMAANVGLSDENDTFAGASLPGISSITGSGQVSYTRRLGRWTGSTAFSFSQGNVDSQFPVNARSYSIDAKASTRLWHKWFFLAGFNMSRSHTALSSESSNNFFNSNVTLASRSWSFGVQQQSGSGYSVLTAFGLIPIGTGQLSSGLIKQAFYTNSRGLSFNGSYTRRRLTWTTIYSTQNFDLSLQAGSRGASNTNLDSQVTYHLRKIDVRAGFRRWSQSTSDATLNNTSTTYYFTFIRQFRLF